MNQKPLGHISGYSAMANQGGDNSYRNSHTHPAYTPEQMQSYGGRPVGVMPGHYPGMYPPGYEEQMRAQAMMRQQSHLQSMHHMSHPSMRAQIPIIMPHPTQMYGMHPQADMTSMPTSRMPAYEMAAGDAEEQGSSAEETAQKLEAPPNPTTETRRNYSEPSVKKSSCMMICMLCVCWSA